MIRPARSEDVPAIASLIRELALYEKLEHEVTASEADLRAGLGFAAHPATSTDAPRAYAEALLAEDGREVVGFALFFHNYSTFVGKPGVYLEDLFVSPHARRRGHGSALLKELARIAVERGCGRFEWSVLEWNEPAIRFYESLGARKMEEWRIFRVTGAALERLART
jgi:ribosomal protein S18 acetylase RimI-like enzyme